MQLNQLYCFMEAVKYRSISVAAEQNYISQSSFSSSISRLEKELGVSLLKRTNTGISVTDYGNYVLEQAKLIFEAQDNIIEASGSENLSGSVSLSSISEIYTPFLPEAVLNIQTESPGILLSLSSGESRQVAKQVSSGYANLGIVINGVYLKSFKDVKYTPLFQDEYFLYVGKKSPLWDKSSASLKEIKKLNYVAYRDEFRKENGGLTELFQKKNFPKVSLSCDDPTFIRQAIIQSEYAAFFPGYAVMNDPYIEKGLLKAIPVSDYDMTFEVGYIESTTYRMSLPEKKVVDVIKSTVKKLCG